MDNGLANSVALERILARHIAGVAREIRDCDFGLLAGFVERKQYRSISDVISGGCERIFVPNTLRFADAADIHLCWGEKPRIEFAMQFQHADVVAYFRLILADEAVDVRLDYLTTGAPTAEGQCLSTRLDRALGTARW